LFKNTQESVALFGGSFDPPHFGHLSIIENAIEMLNIDKLVVVPTFLNPFKVGSHYEPKERLKLSNTLFGKIPKVLIDDYEIKNGKSTPTAQTLKHFQKKYSVDYIIIGADNLASITKWYNFDWLNSEVTWVIATRVGHHLDVTVLKKHKILKIEADISSTQIREKNKGNR
jgi:nicotinate-nucleotide adenylyltransferase